ncbi:MAG TPA: hypothetical protein VLT59_11505, partial [Steroidobacteraceae bacterium]|nr:hypothetical protein [Steroidobacteraceae bacterium]
SWFERTISAVVDTAKTVWSWLTGAAETVSTVATKTASAARAVGRFVVRFTSAVYSGLATIAEYSWAAVCAIGRGLRAIAVALYTFVSAFVKSTIEGWKLGYDVLIEGSKAVARKRAAEGA